MRISLAPRRVTLARVGRGLRPARGEEISRRVDCPGVSDWSPALAELQRLLAEPTRRPADAHVVISDHWAKYAIVPWSDQVAGGKEREALARICLDQVYGGGADSWGLCLAETDPGQPAVVSAAPKTLLEDVRRALEAAGHRFVSAQPQLGAAHDRWRERLPETGGWFVTLDEGTLAAARLSRNGWDRVYAARVGNDWKAELQRLVAFGRLAPGSQEGGRVYVDAPAWLRDLAGDCGPGIEWLAVEPPADTAVASPAKRLRLRV